MIYLRQSTASQPVSLGYFVDSTDGNTEKTALTIANTDIKIWKTGATTLANKNSGGGTAISNGIYYCTLDATDTNTVGPLNLFIHVTGALPVRVPCCVLAANVFDVWFGTNAPATTSALGNITLTSGRVNADLTHISAVAVNSATAQLGVNVVNFGGSAGTFSSGIPSVNATQINGVAGAASNLAKSASVIWQGSVTGATSTTSLVDSTLTQAATDFWKGRIIIFTSGSLQYQASDITSFNAGTHALGFTAMTAAASNADTYVIV